jgi:uncharacterized membrane protein
MDKRFIINFLFFIAFGVLYFSAGIADFLDRTSGKHISAGVIWLVTGVWCYLVSKYFIRIHKLEKKQEVISCVILVIGMILIVIALV